MHVPTLTMTAWRQAGCSARNFQSRLGLGIEKCGILACMTRSGTTRKYVATNKPAFSAQVAISSRADESYSQAEPVFGRLPGSSLWTYPRPFRLEQGETLPEIDVCYETWGQLNAAGDNAVLLHTGLSAHPHAASSAANPQPGWWERFVGPGKPLDTNKYFVVCCNVLGSCYGSTGPWSVNPYTGVAYGTDFPSLTVPDMVRAQFMLLQSLGVSSVHASVGSSLGGMQSLAAGALFSNHVKRVVSISAAARSHPSSIALRFAQRQAIVTDPDWQHGHYYGTGRFPAVGMKTARILGTISYRSGPEWEIRFQNKKMQGLEPPHKRDFGPEFLVETYLNYQGDKFSKRYDPNSLLYVSRAMDVFDLGSGFASLEDGMKRITAPTLVIGVGSDILFPVMQQREVARSLELAGNNAVTYCELDAIYGHDTFLIDYDNIAPMLRDHLEK